MRRTALSLTARVLTLVWSVLLLTQVQTFVNGQQSKSCAEFDRIIKATYNFKPSRLSEAEKEKKSGEMDHVWTLVKDDSGRLLPCLRAAVADPRTDPWFRFDGSNLLVAVDPSPASKAEQVRQYTAVDLDDVNLAVWVPTLARLGAEGFDVSAAGERWLAYPKATYHLPLHGAYEVNRFLGGIFIFGSMDEAHATPALLKIAGSAGHPGRETALSLLLMQATAQAISGLKNVNKEGLLPGAQAALREHLERPKLIAPRDKPKTGRAKFLRAFHEAVNGRWDSFFELVREVPDGEKDVVATLKAEDVPLVRKVRRLMIANANPHAADYYVSFTQILMTLIQQPGVTK